MHFFISNDLTLAEDQAKAMQHSETEFLIFENISLSLSTLSSKKDRVFSKRCSKKVVCLF